MPPYNWIHLENLWWVLAGGTFVAVAIILARTSHTMSFSFKKRTDQQIEDDAHEFAGQIKEKNSPVPIFIWFVGLGWFVWAVYYTIFSGKHGV